MRRRSFLTAGLVLSVTGCSWGDKRVSNDHLRPVRAGDYGLLFSNLFAGEDPAESQGRVVLVDPDGDGAAAVSFVPMDNARLVTHGGALAWLSDDAAHIWKSTHVRWPGLAAPGAVDHLVVAGEGFLGVVNEGSPDGVGYSSGFALFGEGGMQTWQYPGWLGNGVAWFDTHAIGWATSTLMGVEARLTELGPEESGTGFGPEVWGSGVWGGRLVRSGNFVYTIVVPHRDGGAELWRIDPASLTTNPIPLRGPEGVDVDEWYAAGDGPAFLTAVGEELYWLAMGSLWSASIRTGEVREVAELPALESPSWFLDGGGLIAVVRDGHGWSIQDFSPTTAEPRRTVTGISVDGPKDMLPFGAVRVGG